MNKSEPVLENETKNSRILIYKQITLTQPEEQT